MYLVSEQSCPMFWKSCNLVLKVMILLKQTGNKTNLTVMNLGEIQVGTSHCNNWEEIKQSWREIKLN